MILKKARGILSKPPGFYAPKGKINIIMGRRIKSGKRKNVATRDVQDAADRNLGSSHIYAWRLCN
jgi:hypothetical protein